MSNFEKKLESELDSRIKNETDLRNFPELYQKFVEDKMLQEKELTTKKAAKGLANENDIK